MPTLLYIHGFLSSPSSFKAQQLRQYCLASKPNYRFICPQLSPYPEKTFKQLLDIINASTQQVYIIGSSMGGFWATWFVEHSGCKAVLINPATDPVKLMPSYLNVPLKNYHNDEIYRLNETHLSELQKYEIKKIQNKKRYLLLLQTGDETLDYRLAVEKYGGCSQTVEAGGDHSFQGLERYYDDIFNFFELSDQSNAPE